MRARAQNNLLSPATKTPTQICQLIARERGLHTQPFPLIFCNIECLANFSVLSFPLGNILMRWRMATQPYLLQCLVKLTGGEVTSPRLPNLYVPTRQWNFIINAFRTWNELRAMPRSTLALCLVLHWLCFLALKSVRAHSTPSLLKAVRTKSTSYPFPIFLKLGEVPWT